MLVLCGHSGEYSDYDMRVLATSESRDLLEQRIKTLEDIKIKYRHRQEFREKYLKDWQHLIPTIPEPSFLCKTHLGLGPSTINKRRRINIENQARRDQYRKDHNEQVQPFINKLNEEAELYARKRVGWNDQDENANGWACDSFTIEEVPFLPEA